MTNDAKRVLVEFADGSPFGTASVRHLLSCRANRPRRAIQSLVNAGLARPTEQGSITRYELSPQGRDLGSAVFELRSGSKEHDEAVNVDDVDRESGR